jgi:threonine dehydrogenase-like Zn-dependent dehydrogenase
VRGLWLDGSGARLRRDLPEPEPTEGEVLVEVELAGVCATDLALGRGYMGFSGVPGHEFVGRALSGSLRGQRVVGEINAGCGSCELCQSGDPRHCPQRSVLGILGRPGAFAERLSLPEANLLPVPEGVSPEAAVFMEPLAAACALLESVGEVRGVPALVLGDGRLGLLCALVLQEAGAEVQVLGRHPDRAARLGGRLAWVEEPEPRAFPLVVEATGAPDGPARALEWVAPRGTLALKTTVEVPGELDLARIVVDEIRLQGSRCGRFEDALPLLESGRIDPRPLIDGEYPLAEGVAALAHAGQRGTLKVLIRNAP